MTCAADALFMVLEDAGLVGDLVDDRLARCESDGLAVTGWRAEAVINERHPLPPGSDCLDRGDVFALPTAKVERL